MSDSPYFSPSQIGLFINGYLVDDACSIQWEVVDEKRPVWGYNDQDFRRMVKGRSLVQGYLEVNFRYHGYLTRVVKASEKPNFPETLRELQTINRVNNTENYLNLYKQFDSPDVKAEALRKAFETLGQFGIDPQREHKRAQVDELFKQLKNQYWHEDEERRDLPRTIEERPGRLIDDPAFKDGFNILVKFGDFYKNIDSSIDRNTTLLIENVHIIRQPVAISASVPDAGGPIKERYHFMARSIHPYR